MCINYIHNYAYIADIHHHNIALKNYFPFSIFGIFFSISLIQRIIFF